MCDCKFNVCTIFCTDFKKWHSMFLSKSLITSKTKESESKKTQTKRNAYGRFSILMRDLTLAGTKTDKQIFPSGYWGTHTIIIRFNLCACTSQELMLCLKWLELMIELQIFNTCIVIPYIKKICWWYEFGNLEIVAEIAELKSLHFLHTHVPMILLYRQN